MTDSDDTLKAGEGVRGAIIPQSDRCEDIRQIHGVWMMHITEEGSALKSTETRGSMRVVPVHSELIKLGLIEYHASIVARGEKQLFPEIKPDKRDSFPVNCQRSLMTTSAALA